MSYPVGADFFLNGGDAELLLSAPGSGNTGEVSIDLDLSTLPWLRFDWDEDGSPDAAARRGWGTFGRHRGHDRIILWVEQR
jgi:MSHA biogenesis protein MshQ